MDNQETHVGSPTVRETGIRYGLILGVISIAYFVILSVAGADMSGGIARWSGLVFTIIVFFLAHKYFKDNGDGFMSYGQGVGIGFWTSIVSSVISSAFTFIYIKFIDDTFMEMIRNNEIEKMQEKGMSDAQIEQAMGFAEAFMSPTAIVVFGVIGGIIIGVICALIVTIFTQKANPNSLT
ncbi:MAG: DUF4199 domain-containing protein [Cyclobacteriaceae bacterium]